MNKKLQSNFCISNMGGFQEGKALEELFLPVSPLLSFTEHPGAPELGFPSLRLLLSAKP